MDSFTPLREKLRLPQPSLQKFAVSSIFSKLRSAPNYLDSESEPGREAISQCLTSSSPAVVDQSVRELCRLVTDSVIDISRGLLELQSALEGPDPLLSDVFVKGIGFLVRLGFQKSNGSWPFSSIEIHPFVKILSSRIEVQTELLQQVLLLMKQNESLKMVKVCEFLRPFLYYSILRPPFSDSTFPSFARDLISSMAACCCSLPDDSMPVFELLVESLKFIPCKTLQEFQNFINLVGSIMDAYIVVLRRLVARASHYLVTEAQQCGIQLLETILSTCTFLQRNSRGGYERVIELSKCLLSVQKDLGMRYVRELSSVMQSLFMILVRSELEHEQLLLLRFLLFLLQWKGETEQVDSGTSCALSGELLFIFPIVSLMSSPSKSIKGAASELLAMLEKISVRLLTASKVKPDIERGVPSVSTPGSVVFRLLQEIWFQGPCLSSFLFLDFPFSGEEDSKEIHDPSRKSWTSQLKEYSLWLVNLRKSSLPVSKSQEVFITEMPFLLGPLAGVLVMHQSLGCDVVDSLAAIGILDPKLGVPLLLAILFFSSIYTRKDVQYHNKLLKLLEMLPSLASHSAMIPLVVQTILPMLQKDSKTVLFATATRLLCQTWEINDRSFGNLQGILLPKGFSEFKSKREISLSLAASIRDVCRKNADRGVDLILSVSACIESQDPVIQALGLQSLAHLCEADVIDFYTAWDVITKHVLDSYSADPILAHSLCILLRWGAMDAEAYPESSKNVLQILWAVGTSTNTNHILQWTKARVSAWEAFIQYEVPLLERSITDFKQKNTLILLSETDVKVLRAMEEFLVKIVDYEHINRRRVVKEKRVPGSKIEKLLDVFPQVIFSTGKNSARDFPGAALLCLSLTPKDGTNRGTKKESQVLHARYENAIAEIAASLQLLRNLFLALVSLESWKPFMGRWLKADILSFGSKEPTVGMDKASKAAHKILKNLIHIAEESVPRSAENVALAIGALCAVLPPSAHTATSTASTFLLNWLFQHEHEYRQWAAAISLGLISSCLHVTDYKLKSQTIFGLVEVLNASKSILVKGACGVGLGLSCQDLLARVDFDKQAGKKQEVELLALIVKALSLTICQLTCSPTDILESLSEYFPVSMLDVETHINAELSHEKCDDLEEDVWGIAGLVLGLGSSIEALYRAGAYNVVLKIKDSIISWIPHLTSPSQYDQRSMIALSVGSCLALPNVVAFCQRVELMNGNEVDRLVNGYKELISELVSINKSGSSHQCLLMASCIGAGSLLACILNEGVHTIEAEKVKDLLELFKICYSHQYPPIIHFGGMLGVINSVGASAGSLVQKHTKTSLAAIRSHSKESSHVTGPLLGSHVCGPQLMSMMQEIFLVAQNSNVRNMQQYAAWTVSFLRHHLWLKEFLDIDSNTKKDLTANRLLSQNFSEDSVVMKLSLWLINLSTSKTGTIVQLGTVETILRCLSRAPRLPAFDWGGIIRRSMRYEDQDSASNKGTLRDECVLFSLAHANQFDQLLTFLDEISDLSRFRTLEVNLQSCLLFHLADFVIVFSASRVEKLFDDVINYFSSVSSGQVYSQDQIKRLCVSCWKGLHQCLDGASIDSQEYISHMENCMEVLFSLLPVLLYGVNEELGQVNSVEEWSEAIKCLEKARQSWLLEFLQVSLEDVVSRDGLSNDTFKKIQAKAKLTRVGSLPLSELGKLKSQILNSNSKGIWDILVEVVAAVQKAEGRVKRQWLVDAIEISCVSINPSTALRFVGLLSGGCCKYMPLLTWDPQTVLSDLPVTLTSLLSDSGTAWGPVAETIVSSFFASTERIYNWVKYGSSEDDSIPNLQPIAESEREIAISLLPSMHITCVHLKDYLPLEKQLRLANMRVS